jgi:hypothetical protein
MKIAEVIKQPNIEKILKRNFNIEGSVDIVGDIVNITGICDLHRKIQKLPVQFGNVSGDFNCGRNQLTTLEGAPSSVGGGFYCDRNQLPTLEGAPSSVGGDFSCNNNKLTTLKGAPKSVGGSFYCSYSDNLPLLRLLLIKDVKEIYLVPINDIVEDILNKYIGQGRGGALACAAELTKAGFKNNARL